MCRKLYFYHSYLGLWWAHSQTEQREQRFPVDSLPPRAHSLLSGQHPAPECPSVREPSRPVFPRTESPFLSSTGQYSTVWADRSVCSHLLQGIWAAPRFRQVWIKLPWASECSFYVDTSFRLTWVLCQLFVPAVDILVMVSCLVHEHEVSFLLHGLSVCVFSFSYNILSFFRSHMFCLFGCFLNLLLFFDAIVNRIVLIISFWACLGLVYRKTNDFCVLILYLQLCWICLFLIVVCVFMCVYNI